MASVISKEKSVQVGGLLQLIIFEKRAQDDDDYVVTLLL